MSKQFVNFDGNEKLFTKDGRFINISLSSSPLEVHTFGNQGLGELKLENCEIILENMA